MEENLSISAIAAVQKLPPGSRFYPSEEQLLCYYLSNKNNESSEVIDVIGERDLYGHDPFYLPDLACFSYGCGGRKRHWYCYTARVLSEKKRRKGRGGFWKRMGRARDVVRRGAGVVLGMRRSFVFYLGKTMKAAVNTDLVLYEYSLAENQKGSFVLCRVFVRSRCNNSPSSSCAEECVAAVRHVGARYDGGVMSELAEVEGKDDDAFNGENWRIEDDRISAIDNLITGGPISVTGLQFPSSIQQNDLVKLSHLYSDGTVSFEAARFLTSILEEDFIKLEDLVYPVSGYGSSA
ncbi:NAC domain [Dillenia turbinata]|uniref:NAC domain n=1 Tax=Dillenia turbinata TaxID=194707 RepID=A0AAN8W1C5_9MAGN